MWQVNLNISLCHQQNFPIPSSLNTLSEEKPELAKQYHATLFRTVRKTLVQVIKKGYFAMWPNMTVGCTEHITSSMAPYKWSTKQTKKIFQSTKTPAPNLPEYSPMKPLEGCFNTVLTKNIDPQNSALQPTSPASALSSLTGGTITCLYYTTTTTTKTVSQCAR